MENYTLIAYDDVNKEFLVDFVYGDHQLRDRVAIEDIADSDAIKAAVKNAFELFKHTMDKLDAQEVSLPADISEMLGHPQE